MNATVLDTLRCAQTLKNAGFTQEQSEATAQVLGDALADVATKEDLDRHAAVQKEDLDRHAAAQKADMKRLEAKIDGIGSAGKSDLERHAAAHKADLDNAVAGLNAKIDTVAKAAKSDLTAAVDRLEARMDAQDEKSDERNKRLDRIEAKIDDLRGLNVGFKLLSGVVLVMLAAALAVGYAALEAFNRLGAEPQVTLSATPESPPATEARATPPEALPETAPATDVVSPTGKDVRDAADAHAAGSLGDGVPSL